MSQTSIFRRKKMAIKLHKNKQVRDLIRNLYRTQEIFSVVSGIDESRLSKILRGIRKPTQEQKTIFEKYLEVPASDLFPEELTA